MVPSKLETQLGSLCLWISLSLISTSTPLCLRCWKRRSTNLWPSGAAPWNPDCRTGFLFLLIKLGNQGAPSLTIFWSELLLIRGSIAANDTLKTKSWKTQTISFFCISLTDWAALHDVSADFPNCEVTLPLHRLQPELLYSKLQSEKQEVSEWCESHKFSSKDFYVESLGKCSKGSIGCAQWAWDCGLWTIKLHFIKEQTAIFTFSELLGWCLISLTFMSRRWKVLSQHIFLRVCNLTIFPHSKAFPVPDFRLNKLEPGMHYVVGEFWTAQIR